MVERQSTKSLLSFLLPSPRFNPYHQMADAELHQTVGNYFPRDALPGSIPHQPLNNHEALQNHGVTRVSLRV